MIHINFGIKTNSPWTPSPCRVEESELAAGGAPPDTLCTLCEEAKANLEFGPCGHVIMCAKCGERIKKCLECKQIVESRKIIDNDPQVWEMIK